MAPRQEEALDARPFDSFRILGFSAPAAAFSDADRAAVQGIIEQQLQAFLRDDGATAYSFAAPTIKQMYPTVEAFMAMVRQGYPQVYRPRSHSFGELKEQPGHLEQSVEIVDGEGTFLGCALHTASGAGRLLEDHRLLYREEARTGGLGVEAGCARRKVSLTADMTERPAAHPSILIVDFGSQVTQLIARRVRRRAPIARSTVPTRPRMLFGGCSRRE